MDVDLGALVDNARTLARVAGAPLLPVVKADGYGLGAVAVAKALEAVDPWGFGVATVGEGAELRAAGITRRLLVFAPADSRGFDPYLRHRLTPVFDQPAALRAWLARGGGPFHLEVDTGMARTGVRPDDLGAWSSLLDTPAFEGCFTQFHSADRDDRATAGQWDRLTRAVQGFPRRPAVVHAANSAAALRGPTYAGDLIRPGLFLYGGAPGPGLAAGRPVARVRARVLSVRRLAAGDTVSYGATWAASRPTTIATLGIGYADGVRRALSKSPEAHVLLNGERHRIAGLVTMDFTMVDVGDAGVAPGDVATLLGGADGMDITLSALAGWCDESQYAVLTGLGRRLPRVPIR